MSITQILKSSAKLWKDKNLFVGLTHNVPQAPPSRFVLLRPPVPDLAEDELHLIRPIRPWSV